MSLGDLYQTNKTLFLHCVSLTSFELKLNIKLKLDRDREREKERESSENVFQY